MKIIIDRSNPLTVEDQDGNVLFEWTQENATKSSEIDLKSYILGYVKAKNW